MHNDTSHAEVKYQIQLYHYWGQNWFSVGTSLEFTFKFKNTILISTKDWLSSNNNFEYAENELIDYYAYQIKANKTKLDYLIKKAQSKGIILDSINELEIRKIM